MKRTIITGLLSIISTLHASQSPKKYQTNDPIAGQASSGYGSTGQYSELKMWQQIQDKIQEKLQPIANVILHKSIVNDKVDKHFPTFKKYAVPQDYELIKRNCIGLIAKKMISEYDWNASHKSDSSSLDECAVTLQEAVVAKSSRYSWSLLRPIPIDIKQEIEEIPLFTYITIWPEFYGLLESVWAYKTQQEHKEYAFNKMKELLKRYDPSNKTPDNQLTQRFEQYYAIFKKSHIEKK